VTRYTVKQLADLARISVRTLHHYDDIGLLKPAYLGTNSYRYYEQPQLYRLQQILMYREFGLRLDEISDLIGAADFDVASSLRQHRERLLAHLRHQQALLRVIDDTLARLGGDETMQDNAFHDSGLYNWQSPAKQAEYEAWLAERYGPQAHDWIANSQQRMAGFSDADRQSAMDRLKGIEADLVEAFHRGVKADNAVMEPVLTAHREWVAYMWNRPCPPGAYVILADMYAGHPDFVARFESLAEGFCGWLVAAMKAHAERAGEAVSGD
jgi:MerR family transcriptional regulator, thiopeptide resistance regulator